MCQHQHRQKPSNQAHNSTSIKCASWKNDPILVGHSDDYVQPTCIIPITTKSLVPVISTHFIISATWCKSILSHFLIVMWNLTLCNIYNQIKLNILLKALLGVYMKYTRGDVLRDKCSTVFISRHTLSAVFFIHTSTGSALSGILYFELLLSSWVMDSLLCNVKPAKAMDTDKSV